MLLPLRLEPDIAVLPRLVAYIADFGNLHHLPASDVHAVTLAAEELLANTVNHSPMPAHLVDFSLTLTPEGALAVYTDDAPAFDPTAHPEPDITLSASARPIGGLGIHFIRLSMSTFRYRRIDGRNEVTFGRTLSRPS